MVRNEIRIKTIEIRLLILFEFKLLIIFKIETNIIINELMECLIGLAILGKVQFHQTRTASSKTII